MPTLAHPRGDLEYVLIDGDPTLPTLVFLHEGLGSAGQWGRLPALVGAATGMRVLSYSRHGYGGSAGAGPSDAEYLHREALEVLPAVLRDLDIADPILVGHSDGASIALIAASAHPVQAVVAIAPHIVVEELTLTAIRDTASGFAERVRPSLAMFHDDPDAVFDRWSTVWLSPEFADFDLTGLLPAVTAPTLAVQGDGDEYGSPLHLAAVADHSGGPVETRLLAGHGHHPHLTDPAAIAELVTDFVRSVLPSRFPKEGATS